MSSILIGSPFAITASPEIAKCWAGRNEVQSRMHRMEQAFVGRPESSLDVIWAHLGSGKSHALYYLQQRLNDRDGVIPVYVEMPEQPRRFLDLYRQIIHVLPLPRVIPLLQVGSGNADLKKAAQVLQHGGERERGIAREWLSGGRPHLKELREATGIASRLEDDIAASQLLADVARAAAIAKTRLVLLVDEFQRLSSAAPRPRAAILATLRSVFSMSPAYFSAVVAIASRAESTAIELLPGELRTLMGVKPAVSLPAMNEEEACEFLRKRLAFFRPENYSGGPYAPFGEECVQLVVHRIASKGQGLLTPRTVLQTCGYVWDEFMQRDCEALPVTEIAPILDSLRWEN